MRSTADFADDADMRKPFRRHPRDLRHPRFKFSARALPAPLLIVAVVLIVPARADDPWKELRIESADILGTQSCAAASCHGRRESSGGAATLPVGHEYSIWLGTHATYSGGRRHYDPRAQVESRGGDPHAQAAQRMREPRFQDVLRRASQRTDGSLDHNMLARCARCHDPLGLAQQPTELALAPPEESTGHGISCETCHGGGRRWLALHYERDVSRKQLVELGLIDTKSLLVRARLCASCHVGSAENDMNHDMLAAGHPPLRFELASYEALLPQKHWDDRPQRAAEPDYEVQLWAAGRIAAADAALALLQSRAQRAVNDHAAADPAPWPEFAERACYVCHQSLQSSNGAANFLDRSFVGGLPEWPQWNVAMMEPVIVEQRTRNTLTFAFGVRFMVSKEDIRKEVERSLVPDAFRIANLANFARAGLRNDTRISPAGSVLAASGRPLDAGELLEKLSPAKERYDWDTLCQELAALVAVKRSLADHGWLGASAGDEVKLHIERTATLLQITGSSLSASSLQEARRELSALRQELGTLTREHSRGQAAVESSP